MADTELVKAPVVTSLAETGRPDWLPRVSEGTDHITQEDMRIPRLTIAQGLSPQLKRSDPKFIEALRQGDLFNDLTGMIYEGLPLPFFIVRADPPRWMEFKPREEGGGLLDPNVPPNDPRTQWGSNDKGERTKPRATMFYDYVLLLWPSREMIALSLKSSGIKIAKNLNGLIKLRNAPLWSGRYTVDVKDEPSPNGPFPNFVIRNAGFVQTREDAEFLKNVFDGIAGKKLDIEHTDEEHVPENPDNTGAPGAPGSDIPF